MAVMYKIVEGHPPRLPDHFSTSLQYLYTRYCKCIVSVILFQNDGQSPRKKTICYRNTSRSLH